MFTCWSTLPCKRTIQRGTRESLGCSRVDQKASCLCASISLHYSRYKSLQTACSDYLTNLKQMRLPRRLCQGLRLVHTPHACTLYTKYSPNTFGHAFESLENEKSREVGYSSRQVYVCSRGITCYRTRLPNVAGGNCLAWGMSSLEVAAQDRVQLSTLL